MTTRTATRATAAAPCPVCGSGSKGCSTNQDDSHFCRGEPRPGWNRVKQGEEFNTYRKDGDPHAGNGKRAPAPSVPPQDWSLIARDFAANLTTDRRVALADNLGLPPDAIDGLREVGFNPGDPLGACWTFPERNADGTIVGINRRWPKAVLIGGERKNKAVMKGSRRGLYLGTDWGAGTGPALIPEGASDVLALALCGLSVVGRPSAMGGTELLAAALPGAPAGWPLIVIGENDEKDGKWPGRSGAESTAKKLAAGLGRPVSWALPPAGFKDAREWVAARGREFGPDPDWAAVGRGVVAHLTGEARVIDAGPAAGASGLPEIVINGRQYRDVEADAAAALIAANDPPRVFVGNGCGLVDLCRGTPDSPLAARELEAASMRSIFGRVADWFSQKTNNKGEVIRESDFPPPPLLASFPNLGDWPGIPFLRAVVTYPVFGPGWVLNAAPGYHRESGIYSDLGTLELPSAAERPTPDDVGAAKELIVTELLGDFPFVDQASRANAIGMLLLPVIRHAIGGPTPLSVIDAPAEGTGKSLLAEVITLTTIGEIPEAVSPDMDDAEWNKTLLALLIEGQPVVFLDNANRKLDSASLAAALTATWKRGRILGATKIARARVSVCWLLTANNFQCSREIARRVTWSRIDRGMENPADFTDYRHGDILQWVKDNRSQLLGAIVTLVNNWLAKGRPAGTAVLGKFETWARAVGGILNAAGIDGFLANTDELRRHCADQAAEMTAFVTGWYEAHASTPVIAKDLFDIAKGLLDSVLTAKDDEGRRTQLGKFLRKQRDRVYAGYRIVAAMRGDKEDTDYAGRPRYQLQPTKSSKPPEYVEDDDEAIKAWHSG